MQSKSPKRLSGWKLSLFVFSLYVLLTVVMTWPIAANLQGAIPGSEGDALNHLWTFRWVKQSLLAGKSPFFTDLLYYPNGVSLVFHNIAWVHIAAWLPLQAIVGESTAYALLFLLIFPVNGLAAYLLARDVTQSHRAALVGGLVAAFWPYSLSHHNHPNLILIAWAPLTLLGLRKMRANANWRNTFLTALCLALIGLSRWQLLVISSFLIGLYLLSDWLSHRKQYTWRLWRQLGVTAVIATLLMLPLLLPVLTAQFNRNDTSDLFVNETAHQTDLLAYILPNRYHPLWGETVYQWYEHIGVNKTYTPTIGYAVLLLALLGILTQWRKSRFWLLAALLYILLALGSQLHVNGNASIYLPYAWIEDLFFIQIVRHPDRFNVMLSVPVAMLAAWGMKWLVGKQHWVQKSRRSSFLTGFCALLILAEYIVTYPIYPLDTPVWYTQLAQEPGHFGVLDIPLGARSWDKEYMMYQFTHGKPLVGGHVSRLPPEAYAFIDSVPLLHSLRDAPQSPPDMSNVSHQLQLLRAVDVRYLVLHKKFLGSEQEAAWQTWLTLPPLYADEAVIVYSTETTVPTLTPIPDTPIGLVGTAVSPSNVSSANLVYIDLNWGSTTAVTTDYTACLIFQHDTEIVWQKCEPLAPDWPTAQWQAGEWVHRRHAVQLDPFWPAGIYDVSVSLGIGGAPVSIGTFTHDAPPRSFTRPEPGVETAVTWHNDIVLIGYDLAADEALNLTLYWQALRRMERPYKVFVHVISSAGQNLAAQADFVPQQWQYPTDWWETGEYITDPVNIPLDHLPAGEYEVMIGLYDANTGERQPPLNAAGNEYENQSVPLGTIVR